MNSQPKKNNYISQAQKGASAGIFVYLILTVIKLLGSWLFNSASLRADGLNNLSDIFSSLAVLIGLKLAQKPADEDHHFGHEKYEALSSFVVAIIMILLGVDIISTGVRSLWTQNYTYVAIEAIWVPLGSIVLLFIAYLYINRLAQQSKSMGLRATQQDMRNDILVTLSTIIGIIGSQFEILWLDSLISSLVGVIIIISAIDILKDSSFNLSDGFDEEELQRYKYAIAKHPQVINVPSIRARLSGRNTYVDVVIEIDPHLSVYDSHEITVEIEEIMYYKFDINDVDIHVEPYLGDK